MRKTVSFGVQCLVPKRIVQTKLLLGLDTTQSQRPYPRAHNKPELTETKRILQIIGNDAGEGRQPLKIEGASDGFQESSMAQLWH